MRTTSNSKLTVEQARAFGKELRKRRNDVGFTTKEFASLIGCTGTYLSSIENGNKKPSPQLTSHILNVLGVELSDMLNTENNMAVAEERKQYGKKLFEKRMDKGLSRTTIAGALGIPVSVYAGFERGECSITDRHKELLDKLLDINAPVVEEPVFEEVQDEPTVCDIILNHIKDLQVDIDTQKRVWRYFTDMKIDEEERRLFG